MPCRQPDACFRRPTMIYAPLIPDAATPMLSPFDAMMLLTLPPCRHALPDIMPFS